LVSSPAVVCSVAQKSISLTLEKDTDHKYQIEWNITFGGDKTEWGPGLYIDSDDTIFLAGFTESYGAGLYDAYILKVSKSGEIIKNITYGTADRDYGIGITGDEEYVYLVGMTDHNTVGSFDALVVKFDKDLDPVWNTTWGGISIEHCCNIALDNARNIYINGYTYSFGAGDCDMCLVKFNSSGYCIWNTTWGRINPEELNFTRHISQSPAPKLYV